MSVEKFHNCSQHVVGESDIFWGQQTRDIQATTSFSSLESAADSYLLKPTFLISEDKSRRMLCDATEAFTVWMWSAGGGGCCDGGSGTCAGML